MAKALPGDGKIISIEFNPENYKNAKALVEPSDVADKIELKHGDANKILMDLEINPDIVFIDADKPSYANYLDWALAHVNVGGLIIGDNTFLFGHMIGEDRGQKTSESAIAAMSKFNEVLANHPDYFSMMIPTHEGMTVGLRVK
jgi:predicted O-methyltransferase YrrM